MDNGISEVDVKRYELGPGIKYALVWLCIISSFAAGWYMRGEIYMGELASANLTQLEKDINNKEDNRKEKEVNRAKLAAKLEGKTYDEACGNTKLGDFYK